MDRFNGCSSGPALVHPKISAMLWAVGDLGGLPYTWGCHVLATTGSGDDTAAITTPDRSTGGFLLLQSIIINISRGSRHTSAANDKRMTATHFSRTARTRVHRLSTGRDGTVSDETQFLLCNKRYYVHTSLYGRKIVSRKAHCKHTRAHTTTLAHVNADDLERITTNK